MSADYPLYQYKKREAAVVIFLAAENKGKGGLSWGQTWQRLIFNNDMECPLSTSHGSPCIYLNPTGHGRGGGKPSGKRWSSIQCFSTRLSTGDSDTGQRTSLSNEESTDLLTNAVRTQRVSGDWHDQLGGGGRWQLWRPLSRGLKSKWEQGGGERTTIGRRQQCWQTLGDGRAGAKGAFILDLGSDLILALSKADNYIWSSLGYQLKK